MEKIILSAITLLLAFSVISCEKTDSPLPAVASQQDQNPGYNAGDDPQDQSGENHAFPLSPEGLTHNLESGSWQISLFIEDFDNETDDFAGYVFTFNTNGTVEARKGNTTRSGSWGTYTDDGETEFQMSFPYADYFDELSDDWYLKINTSEKIRFEGSNPNEDVLVFIPY